MGCRGQGYDKANNMSGWLSGVQARISAENPKAFYVRCFLNLVVQDSVRIVQNTLDTIQELIHFHQRDGFI